MTTVAIDTPVIWNRTIIRGADNIWRTRRVDSEGAPIIPTSAAAQVRRTFGGELWIDIDVSIDGTDGWITLTIAEDDTAGAEWDTRTSGRWDLEVVVSGQKLRWTQGAVSVSQDVTRDE